MYGICVYQWKMTDPAEIVTGIFTTVVMLVVLILLYGALQGWDISNISQYVSAFAVPFIALLVFLFFILSILEVIRGV